jgi:DNA-binding beta-propeller fold protein YncE
MFYAALFFLLATWGISSPALCQQEDIPVIKARHLFDIKDGFLHPSDVAVGPQGDIYVLDGVNNRIKVFSSGGKCRFSFGSQGEGNGKFKYPLGLDVDKDGSIYIADSGNHLVQIFDSGGYFKFQFPVKVKNGKKPSDPTDVAIDESQNRCYVIDNDNHAVLVYPADGSRLLEQWGSRGFERGQFYNPFLAAVGQDSSIYVVEVLNTRVQSLNPEGKVISVIGKWGIDRGQFYRPKGVAVDKKNRVFVSDSYLGVIQVFNKNGSFISVLNDTNGKLLRLQTPVGIAVDHKLRLYVVEMTQNRVRVFQIQD